MIGHCSMKGKKKWYSEPGRLLNELGGQGGGGEAGMLFRLGGMA